MQKLLRTLAAFGGLVCVALAAHDSAPAGVVAEETIAIDFLQMFTMDTRVTTSIEGNKARLDYTVRMSEGQSHSSDEDTHATEIQRLDRGVLYSLIESARQYRERELERPAAVMDSSRQIAAIASGLKCQWAAVDVAKNQVGREFVGGASAAHVRIDASHRCLASTPGGHSCTLAVAYDQWSTPPNELHSQLIRYRHDYAAKAGTKTEISEAFEVFSQFGVPVDPILLQSLRATIAPEGMALKTSAELRASRSCFTTEGVSDTATAQSTQSEQSYPAFLIQYVGAMLLYAWVAEHGPQSADDSAAGSQDEIETLGTISTELSAIRAQQIPASQFELPAGFTRIF